MGLVVIPQQFPPPQNPIVDKSGCAIGDGMYLLIALYNRTGGGDGAPNISTSLTAAIAPNVPLITADWNEFTTVPAGGAAQIPAVLFGSDFIVWNFGANALAVTPQPGVQIDALGAGVAYSLAVGKMQWFRCKAPTQIYSTQLG